jgi:hypothetical protein
VVDVDPRALAPSALTGGGAVPKGRSLADPDRADALDLRMSHVEKRTT